ncbi:MAG: S8 family serine peptidase [Anaerolineae bacterium]|nr:S8 family serine peptidase [Anaerolineae bacterium]MDW8173620.1 S8 family serine peptidase [Anaerolineae bacterium]
MPRFKFVSNYPHYAEDHVTLLPTPTRVQALPDYCGRGVNIAFVDSGFSRHPDIADRIIVHADASTRHIIEQPTVMDISPLSWHGQMTSVICAGDGRVSGGHFRGIAYEARLILVKVSTPQGAIKEADILRGLRWLYDTRRRYKPHIVNVSVGGDEVSHDPHHPLHTAVRKLVNAGIVVIIAAGNSGHSFIVPPASAPEALTIGGYNDHNSLDRRQWSLYHHNYACAYDGTPKPELIAPASLIASPLLPDSATAREIGVLAQLLHVRGRETIKRIVQEHHEVLGVAEDAVMDAEMLNYLQGRIYHHKVIDAQHQHVDGSSVAAPIVASVVAQMLEANPCLTPSQVRQILLDTAQPLPNVPEAMQGAGCLNAAEAVIAARDLVIA